MFRGRQPDYLWDLLVASAVKSGMYPRRIWWIPSEPPVVIPGETLELLYCQMTEKPTHETLTSLAVEGRDDEDDDDDDERAFRAVAPLIYRPRRIGDASVVPRGRCIGDDSMHRWMLLAMHRRRGATL